MRKARDNLCEIKSENQLAFGKKCPARFPRPAVCIFEAENPQRADTEGNYMAAAETSTILRFVASVPRLTFPPPPKPSPLGFHRVKLSLLNNRKFEIIQCAVCPPIAFFASCIFILSGLRFNSAVLLVFLRQDESLDSPTSLESA
jgi:hypothetical protein